MLSAAEVVFSRHGYHRTSVDQIVRAAGRSKGAAYFHFGSKLDIFDALLRSMAKKLQGRVRAAMEDHDDPAARLDAALSTVLALFAANGRLARMVLVELQGQSETPNRAMGHIRAGMIDLISEEIAAAMRAGAAPPADPELLASIWYGAINDFVIDRLRTGRPIDPHDSDQLQATLLTSIGVSNGTQQLR